MNSNPLSLRYRFYYRTRLVFARRNSQLSSVAFRSFRSYFSRQGFACRRIAYPDGSAHRFPPFTGHQLFKRAECIERNETHGIKRCIRFPVARPRFRNSGHACISPPFFFLCPSLSLSRRNTHTHIDYYTRRLSVIVRTVASRESTLSLTANRYLSTPDPSLTITIFEREFGKFCGRWFHSFFSFFFFFYARNISFKKFCSGEIESQLTFVMDNE